MTNMLEVHFFRTEQNEITGRIFFDPRPIEIAKEAVFTDEDPGSELAQLLNNNTASVRKAPRIGKIVLIYGYLPEKVNDWQYPLPLHGEYWRCQEIRDTKPEDPRKGAILVRLFENLTEKEKNVVESKKGKLAPITKFLFSSETVGGSAKTETEVFEMACEIKGYSEFAVDMIGLEKCLEVFRSLRSNNSLVGLHLQLSKFDFRLTKHYFWTQLQQYDMNESVRRLCLEGIITWLEKIKREGLKINKEFKFLGEQMFQCPRCPTKVKMKENEWQQFNARQEIQLECPVCGTVGPVVE